MSRQADSTPKNTKQERIVFARNLRRYLEQKGMTQVALADALDRSPSSVNNWVQAVAIPPYTDVVRIAELFQIHPDDLYSPPSRYSTRTSIRIPVVSSVIRNDDTGEFEQVEDFVEIPSSWIKQSQGRYFGYRMPDASLSPRVESGDVLIVQTCPEIRDVTRLYLMLDGTQTRLCRYITQDNGFILAAPWPQMMSSNHRETWQAARYYSGTLDDYDALTIAGMVVYLYAKL